jgi:L-seryl-tRNA(Ser) seleniumtransferase
MRVDKLALAALEATLPLYSDPARAARDLPVLAMLRATATELRPRAEWLAAALARGVPGLEARVVEASGEVGGGSMPQQRLPGVVVAVRCAGRTAQALEAAARAADPPVIAVVRAGWLRLDPRTLLGDDLGAAAEALVPAWRG